MPRPLIVKVEDHRLQPGKKANGSISTQLLRENRTNLYGSYNQDINGLASVTDNDHIDAIHESGSGSLVRSLISRYESSVFATRSTLIKQKSKSLSDLVQPQLSITRNIRETNNSYNNAESRDESFNFKKVLSKFETDKGRIVHKAKIYKYHDDSNLQNNDMKVKARELLQNYREFSSDSELLWKWQDEVVQFLQGLSDSTSAIIEKRESPKEPAKDEYGTEEHVHTVNDNEVSALTRSKSLDSNEFSKRLKVKEAKNIFEANSSFEAKVTSVSPKTISRSISAFTSYFTGKPADDDDASFPKATYVKRQQSELSHYSGSFIKIDNDETADSDNEGSYDIQAESGRIVTQPIMASSTKIRELKDMFESGNVNNKYVPYEKFTTRANEDHPLLRENNVDKRMLPPPMVVTQEDDEDEEDDLETSKQQIDELLKEIEEYEVKVDNITREDKEEGSYINEELIRILINLDDVKTYGIGVIQTERRKAIQFVQNCIKKLRGKMRGYE